ncbi:MAG: YcbK family protein [Proteobacteria bacterium]|nr:YcbK family protein [Pseudomonadota bacterium]
MSESTFSRRKFLILASSFMAVTATPTLAASVLSKTRPRFSTRKISLSNIHSGEEFEGIYWREGYYDEKALARLAHLLRDRRNNKQHSFDGRLFDVLHRLQVSLGTQQPYEVICGYRSSATNATLHKKSKKVAKNSLHMQGKAIDLRLEHTPLKELCDAARALKAGGVGYYPKSNFIHVDVRPKPTFWT